MLPGFIQTSIVKHSITIAGINAVTSPHSCNSTLILVQPDNHEVYNHCQIEDIAAYKQVLLLSWDNIPNKTIKLFEPRNALTDEFDGLRFYRRISEKGMSWLKPGGTILMEVGRGKHPEMAAELFSSENWGGIKIFSDYNGDNRILKVSRI